MDLLQNSAVTIGFIAAIITGLGVIWLKAVKPFYRRTRAGLHMIQRVTQDQIDRIDAVTLGNHKSAEEHWRKLDQRLEDVAKLVEARHGEMTARLGNIERYLEPTGLSLAVTLQQDGPVSVTIVEEDTP